MVRRTPTTLLIGVTALAFALVACTPGTQATASPTAEEAASIVGTWNCTLADETHNVNDVVEIRADGTVTITDAEDEAQTGELTWTVEGDRVSFDGDPGTIESEDRIVFDSGVVCTRAN